jgi:hypothetical protein
MPERDVRLLVLVLSVPLVTIIDSARDCNLDRHGVELKLERHGYRRECWSGTFLDKALRN